MITKSLHNGFILLIISSFLFGCSNTKSSFSKSHKKAFKAPYTALNPGKTGAIHVRQK